MFYYFIGLGFKGSNLCLYGTHVENTYQQHAVCPGVGQAGGGAGCSQTLLRAAPCEAEGLAEGGSCPSVLSYEACPVGTWFCVCTHMSTCTEHTRAYTTHAHKPTHRHKHARRYTIHACIHAQNTHTDAHMGTRHTCTPYTNTCTEYTYRHTPLVCTVHTCSQSTHVGTRRCTIGIHHTCTQAYTETHAYMQVHQTYMHTRTEYTHRHTQRHVHTPHMYIARTQMRTRMCTPMGTQTDTGTRHAHMHRVDTHHTCTQHTRRCTHVCTHRHGYTPRTQAQSRHTGTHTEIHTSYTTLAHSPHTGTHAGPRARLWLEVPSAACPVWWWDGRKGGSSRLRRFSR